MIPWLYHLCIGRVCHISVFMCCLGVFFGALWRTVFVHVSFKPRLLSFLLTDVCPNLRGGLLCLAPVASSGLLHLLTVPWWASALHHVELWVQWTPQSVENKHSPCPHDVYTLTEKTIINNGDQDDALLQRKCRVLWVCMTRASLNIEASGRPAEELMSKLNPEGWVDADGQVKNISGRRNTFP